MAAKVHCGLWREGLLDDPTSSWLCSRAGDSSPVLGLEVAAQPDASESGWGQDQVWPAECQSHFLTPSWEGWGSPVCMGSRAMQSGGGQAQGLSMQEGLVTHPIRPSGLLFTQRALIHRSCGWDQSCGTVAAGTWPRSHQTAERGSVFTLLVTTSPPSLWFVDCHRHRRT